MQDGVEICALARFPLKSRGKSAAPTDRSVELIPDFEGSVNGNPLPGGPTLPLDGAPFYGLIFNCFKLTRACGSSYRRFLRR
jgi:hypothetical protein